MTVESSHIEPQPLLPLSGHVPISLNHPNKEHLALTSQEKANIYERITEDSIPWTSLLLVPLIGILLILVIYRLRNTI